jgi:predicted metalloendopeptidase
LLAVTSGTKGKKPRDELCTIYTWSLFPLPVDLLYVRNYFQLETKKRVEEMVQQMRGVFEAVIKENEWMDQQTKSYASKKVCYPFQISKICV